MFSKENKDFLESLPLPPNASTKRKEKINK
jgi:hypothetical protein